MERTKWERALSQLHRTVQEPSDGELSLLIHYWGAKTDHTSNPVHKHSFFEACYVVDQEGVYHEEGRVYPLRKGTLFISRPYKVHQIRSDGMPLLWVAFEIVAEHSTDRWKERFARLAEGDCFVLQDAGQTPAVLLWNALMQAAAGQASDELPIERLGHMLIACLPQTFSNEQREQRPIEAMPRSALLQQATLFIRDNLDTQLKVEDVARYFHLSGRHLARLFAGELAMTFTEYVRKERVSKAALLLRDSNRSIKQIADETGFGSVHYFTRVFSAVAGMSPAAYRTARKY